MTAQDVVFSLNALKENGHPIITQSLRDFAGCEAADDATVIARFAPKRARDVPLFVAGLPIFSRAYYGKRPFEESTLDIPLGSGPYRVGRFEAGRYIEYKRVPDWWGADLPVSRGQYNFDTLRYEYYRDRDIGFEGFTAKSYLFREEFTSRLWATRYNFPAIKDGRVKRDVLPDDTPSGAQGWFINCRRSKFSDPKLREALGCAFDFEWTNKNIMFGSYDRTQSVFQNSDMMATGKPSADELALLEPFRGKVPDEVFGEPYLPPVSDGSGHDRALLRRASQLLQEAGYVIKDGKRVSPKGERFSLEFLLDEPSFQPHHMPYIQNLKTLGIDATLAHRRSGPGPAAAEGFRLRPGHPAVRLLGDAGRFAPQLFFIPGRRDERLAESRRHRRSGDRRLDRPRHRRELPGRAEHGLPGARPLDPGRPLLDTALVQGVALDRVLGYVRPAAGQAAVFSGGAGNVVV